MGSVSQLCEGKLETIAHGCSSYHCAHAHCAYIVLMGLTVVINHGGRWHFSSKCIQINEQYIDWIMTIPVLKWDVLTYSKI